MSTKIKNQVICDCKKCNGKCVEERTRKRHIELEHRLASSVSGFVPFLPGNNCDKPAHTALEIDHDPIAEGLSSSKKIAEEKSILVDSNYESDVANFIFFIPQKRQRPDQFREPEVNHPIDDIYCYKRKWHSN